jgi:hypothetical protein
MPFVSGLKVFERDLTAPQWNAYASTSYEGAQRVAQLRAIPIDVTRKDKSLRYYPYLPLVQPSLCLQGLQAARDTRDARRRIREAGRAIPVSSPRAEGRGESAHGSLGI